jgi:glyoxylase-like metal-dependent hydrolase (beta-lactamase superfamily II)
MTSRGGLTTHHDQLLGAGAGALTTNHRRAAMEERTENEEMTPQTGESPMIGEGPTMGEPRMGNEPSMGASSMNEPMLGENPMTGENPAMGKAPKKGEHESLGQRPDGVRITSPPILTGAHVSDTTPVGPERIRTGTAAIHRPGPASAQSATRRAFLAGAGSAAIVPTTAALLGGPFAGVARAAESPHRSGGFAPIPTSALGPQVNADGYFVGQIEGNLYWVTDATYISMFFTTAEGVVVVDAPPTIGNNLLRAISEVTAANGRPGNVTHFIYSHSHADHEGAASLFGPDVVRIGHELCRALLVRDNDPHRPPPTVTFSQGYTVDVGGEKLELTYHGPNHSPDNIFIYAPKYRTLMLVDVVFPGWVPFKDLAVSQAIPDWIKAHHLALSYPWETYVGGHNGRLGSRRDVQVQIAYVEDLITAARATMSNLDPAPLFKKYGNNSWAIFRAYLNEASALTAAPVTDKYLGKLAGADIFTVDNAYTIFEFSLREDGGVLGPFGIHP